MRLDLHRLSFSVLIIFVLFLFGCGSSGKPGLSSSTSENLPAPSSPPEPTSVPAVLSDDLEATDSVGNKISIVEFSSVVVLNTRVRGLRVRPKPGKILTNLRFKFINEAFNFSAPDNAEPLYPGDKGTCKSEISAQCLITLRLQPKLTEQSIVDESLGFTSQPGKLQITYNLKDEVEDRLFEISLSGITPFPGHIEVQNFTNNEMNQQFLFPNPNGSSVHLPRVRYGDIRTFDIRVTRTRMTPLGAFSWTLNSEIFSVKQPVNNNKYCGVNTLVDSNYCLIRIEIDGRKAKGLLTGSLVFKFFDFYKINEISIHLETFIEDLDFRENLLIIYNNGGQTSSCTTFSCSMLNLYTKFRPGLEGGGFPNTLGVNLPFNKSNYSDAIGAEIFWNNLVEPVKAWIRANSLQKKISYIIMMPEISFRTEQILSVNETEQLLSGSSTAVRLRTALLNDNLIRPDGGLVAHIDMGSEANTQAYLDKILHASRSAPSSLIISGKTANVSGDTYYLLDDGMPNRINTTFSSHKEYLELLQLPGMETNNRVIYSTELYKTSRPAPVFENVTGFQTWGVNGANLAGIISRHYPNDGTFKFSGRSSWYLLKTIESYNGVWGRNFFQGNYLKFFSDNAFGGEAYSNTPVGVVTHVEEPLLDGTNYPNYFQCWELGNTFVDCAWRTAHTPYFAAIGDPLVVR